MASNLFNNVIKFTILYQLLCYSPVIRVKVCALERSSCIGKHQMSLETTTANLDIVVENFEPIEFTDFDKMPSESILKRSDYGIMIHLQYNDTVPTIKVNFKTSLGVEGTFRFAFLYFQWFEQVSDSLSNKNITFPGELHALFYNENANNLEYALTLNKGVIALAFDIEVNPLQPYNFDVLQENLIYVQDPFSKTTIANLNLEYWLKSYMKHFYVYEGSLYEIYCNETVLWIDFTDAVAMPPKVVEKFEMLKDHQLKTIMREIRQTVKPKGKVFANGTPISTLAQAPPPLAIYPRAGNFPQILITKQVKVLMVLCSLLLIIY